MGSGKSQSRKELGSAGIGREVKVRSKIVRCDQGRFPR